MPPPTPIGFVEAWAPSTLLGPIPQGIIYLNDFARVVSSDNQAVNGVLHFIDRVLLPPEVLHWKPDTAPVPLVWPGCGPGSWAPVLSGFTQECFFPEKHLRSRRELRIQDPQPPTEGTALVCVLHRRVSTRECLRASDMCAYLKGKIPKSSS